MFKENVFQEFFFVIVFCGLFWVLGDLMFGELSIEKVLSMMDLQRAFGICSMSVGFWSLLMASQGKKQRLGCIFLCFLF